MRSYPVVVPVGCFALGIWVGDTGLGGFWIWWATALIAGGFSLGRFSPPWVLGLMLFAAGGACLQFQRTPWDPDDLQRLSLPAESIVTLEGRLAETATVRRTVSNGKLFETSSVLLNANALENPVSGEIRPVRGKVLITGSGAMPPGFLEGRRIRFTGVLSAPEGALSPGAFDYADYLRRNGVFFRLQTGGARDWQIDSRETIPPPSLSDRFLSWGRHTLGLGFPESDPVIQLIWAMVLGWKPGLSHEMQEPFMQSGTIHVFAISGLHIALLATILVEFLRLFSIPRSVAGWLAVPVIWIYTGMTGWQASAIRSTVMMTVVVGSWSLARPGNLLNSLAGAAGILLVWDPQQLFQAGFQLSFGVVWSLGVLAPRLEAGLQAFRWSDRMLPDRLRSRLQTGLDRAWHWIASNLAVSLAAWIGSLPLIAHYFHIVNPVSLLANLVVVPLSSLSLASSVASLGVGAWWAWGAELFNHSSWLWMHGMVRISQWAANLPGGCWNVASPGWEGFGLYYGGLLGWLFRSRLSVRSRWGIGAMLVICLIGGVARWMGSISSAEMVLLPRRSGATCWVKPSGGWSSMLIDPGDARSVERVVEPFLRSRGVNRLSEVIVTHGTVGAMGGMERLEERFGIGARQAPEGLSRSPYVRRWEEFLRARGLKWESCSAGQTIRGFGEVEVLHPERSRGRTWSTDDGAMVLRWNWGGVRVLWLSQLGFQGQQRLLERTEDLRADWVLAGMPGRGEPLLDPLLDRIQPRVVVIMEAEYPASAHASEALKRRLRSRGIPIWWMRETGALEIRSMSGQIHVRPWRKPSLPIPVSEDASTADDR